jgi:phosphoglycerol transferase MdoB-like AlkP superfamily enzyme
MIPHYARFLAKLYLYLIGLLALSRGTALFMIRENVKGESEAQILKAFMMGWRFDNVITCAVLLIPFVIFTLNQYVIKRQWVQRLAVWPVYVFLPIIILLQMIDLGYFDQFYVRITVVLFNWLSDLSFALRMIKDEPLWLFGGLAIPLVIYLLLLPIRLWSRKNFYHPLVGKSGWVCAFASPVILALMLLGVRGRVALKSPIREGTAFYSQNPTLNYLALNPTFTFFASWVRSRKYNQKSLRFMSSSRATEIVQRFYQITPLEGKNSLTREMKGGEQKDWNIVFVIMEGMSAHYTHYRKKPSWTPHLDRLMQEGLEFKQAYSAGIHTFNGVWSSLFSFPSPYTTHPLKRDTIPQLNAFSSQMAQKGVQTFFFTTHDDQFDNMAGFVRQNGFNRVVSLDDYPSERVFSILGVPDHDMFHASLPILSEADKQGRFFVAMLTGSNHKPHIIPPELKSKFNLKDEKENIVRYADWAIGDFIEQASKQEWFNRTLFVFFADHGQAVGAKKFDQILSYHHVPFIIWNPKLIKPQKVLSPVMQVDVMPTLMGLLGGDWLNSTLGSDVLKSPRDWVYVGRDVTTCLVTANGLDCETQDRDHTTQKFSRPQWPTKNKTSQEYKWDIIHAELQLSDRVLREFIEFP